MFCFSLKDAVCLLSLWFSFCGCFFGAYWHFLSVETVCKLFKMFYSKWETELRYYDQLNTPPLGWRKTYSCCILTPMPWARLHPTISPSLKRKRICYSFILSQLVYHFTMRTLQKHHYTNNPTTKNTFIIAQNFAASLCYLWHMQLPFVTYGICSFLFF